MVTTDDQDGAVSLFLAGAITPQTYVNGQRALAVPAYTGPHSTSPQAKDSPSPARRGQEGEQPRRRRILPAPRAAAEEGEQLRRRRILPVPPSTGEQPRRRTTRESAQAGVSPDSLGYWLVPARVADGGASRAPPQRRPHGFPRGVRPQIRAKLEKEIKVRNSVKFQLTLMVHLRKDNQDGSEEYTAPVLRHKQAIMQNSEIEEALNRALPSIQEILEKWTQRGSSWVVDRVETIWLAIARYQPLRGGSYIPTPPALRAKKALVTVKNKNDHCFWWTLRSILFPARDHVDRPSKYPTDDGLIRERIDSPTPISQIPRAERQNDLAINVFGWDKWAVVVHHISKQPEDMPRRNMLLIEKAGKTHYTRIKDLNRLLYDRSKHKERKHFCERCLHGYTREVLLEAHKPECRGIGQTAVRVEMPEEGKNKPAFQNHHKHLPAPYIIYADFEALTTKVEGPELDPTKSNTQRTQHYEACSYSYIVVRCDGQTEPPVE